jgi:hypothetical protein
VTYFEWLLAGPYGYERWTFAFDVFIVVGLVGIGTYCLYHAVKEMN